MFQSNMKFDVNDDDEPLKYGENKMQWVADQIRDYDDNHRDDSTPNLESHSHFFEYFKFWKKTVNLFFRNLFSSESSVAWSKKKVQDYTTGSLMIDPCT